MIHSKTLWAAALTLVGACERSSQAEPPAPSKPKTIAVTVTDAGFAPSEIKIVKGEPTTLVFTRTTDATCAKEVAFPELKITKVLPLDQPVAVEVPVGEARTLTFQCGMGMFKSKLVIA